VRVSWSTSLREAVDAVIVAAPEDDAVDGEAVLFGHAARGQILGADYRNNMTAAEGGEGIVADGQRGFGGDSLVPVMEMDVVADFEFRQGRRLPARRGRSRR